MSDFQDKELTCKECGQKFTWSAGEQEYFREQGFDPPKRCKACKRAQRAARPDNYPKRGRW